MRVLVTGGRDLSDALRAELHKLLDELHVQEPITFLIEGGAAGADSVARRWALLHGVSKATIYADWSSGYSAGPRRNEEMLFKYKPDLVIAAPGKSGALDCRSKARALGIPILEIVE